jgi:hypothetical protein
MIGGFNIQCILCKSERPVNKFVNKKLPICDSCKGELGLSLDDINDYIDRRVMNTVLKYLNTIVKDLLPQTIVDIVNNNEEIEFTISTKKDNRWQHENSG